VRYSLFIVVCTTRNVCNFSLEGTVLFNCRCTYEHGSQLAHSRRH